jgi:hypothetical protein
VVCLRQYRSRVGPRLIVRGGGSGESLATLPFRFDFIAVLICAGCAIFYMQIRFFTKSF